MIVLFFFGCPFARWQEARAPPPPVNRSSHPLPTHYLAMLDPFRPPRPPLPLPSCLLYPFFVTWAWWVTSLERKSIFCSHGQVCSACKNNGLTLFYIEILLQVVFWIWLLYIALYWTGNNIHARFDLIQSWLGQFGSTGNQITVDSYTLRNYQTQTNRIL